MSLSGSSSPPRTHTSSSRAASRSHLDEHRLRSRAVVARARAWPSARPARSNTGARVRVTRSRERISAAARGGEKSARARAQVPTRAGGVGTALAHLHVVDRFGAGPSSRAAISSTHRDGMMDAEAGGATPPHAAAAASSAARNVGARFAAAPPPLVARAPLVPPLGLRGGFGGSARPQSRPPRPRSRPACRAS